MFDLRHQITLSNCCDVNFPCLSWSHCGLFTVYGLTPHFEQHWSHGNRNGKKQAVTYGRGWDPGGLRVEDPARAQACRWSVASKRKWRWWLLIDDLNFQGQKGRLNLAPWAIGSLCKFLSKGVGLSVLCCVIFLDIPSESKILAAVWMLCILCVYLEFLCCMPLFHDFWFSAFFSIYSIQRTELGCFGSILLLEVCRGAFSGMDDFCLE